MKIDTQSHGTVAVVTPHAPLAGDEVEQFRNALSLAIDQRGGRVVLNMGDVPYLDSRGIEALLELCTAQPVAGERPRLAALTETCREALDLTDVLASLAVFDTVDSAIRSFKR